MSKILSFIDFGNLHICEDSIKDILGDSKLEEFCFAAKKLEDIYCRLNKSGIKVLIYASEKGFSYNFQDNNGEIIHNSQNIESLDANPYVVLGNALTKAMYIINKKIANAINILKS